MAHLRGNSKATGPRHRRRENLTSLSTKVLRVRLYALYLSITGNKVELISRFPVPRVNSTCFGTSQMKLSQNHARWSTSRQCKTQTLIHPVYCSSSLPIGRFHSISRQWRNVQLLVDKQKKLHCTESSAFVHQHGGDDVTRTRPSSTGIGT